MLGLMAVLAVSPAQRVLALTPVQRAAVSQPPPVAPGGFAVLPLSMPPLVAGQATVQVVPQSNQTYGTFGYRTLGQSFVPSPATFGGGIQTGPEGGFLSVGRSDGSAMFTTPGPQIGQQQAAGGTPAAQPALNPSLSPETSSQENTGAAGEGLVMPTDSGPATASAATVPRFGTAAAAAAPQGAQPFTRSPELSDLLTRIARSKGMLSGQGIDVYLSNDIARVQGTVRTAHDCVLLPSVLALEPDVRQIDNRLVVEGSGTVSSK